MQSQDPPRDSDPSDMTDFEKNATTEELEQLLPREPDPSRRRHERGNRGPGEEPGFGQGD